jgi:hypothetical protein
MLWRDCNHFHALRVNGTLHEQPTGTLPEPMASSPLVGKPFHFGWEQRCRALPQAAAFLRGWAALQFINSLKRKSNFGIGRGSICLPRRLCTEETRQWRARMRIFRFSDCIISKERPDSFLTDPLSTQQQPGAILHCAVMRRLRSNNWARLFPLVYCPHCIWKCSIEQELYPFLFIKKSIAIRLFKEFSVLHRVQRCTTRPTKASLWTTTNPVLACIVYSFSIDCLFIHTKVSPSSLLAKIFALPHSSSPCFQHAQLFPAPPPNRPNNIRRIHIVKRFTIQASSGCTSAISSAKPCSSSLPWHARSNLFPRRGKPSFTQLYGSINLFYVIFS